MANNRFRRSKWIGYSIAAIVFLAAAYKESARAGGQDTARDCLARNIYHEARGEPTAGQIAVAHVTRNRVEDPRWPSTYCEVIYQPHQFSWTGDDISDGMPDERARAEAYRVADLALSLPDYTDGANHYHATYVKPYWADETKWTLWLANHIFYRL